MATTSSTAWVAATSLRRPENGARTPRGRGSDAASADRSALAAARTTDSDQTTSASHTASANQTTTASTVVRTRLSAQSGPGLSSVGQPGIRGLERRYARKQVVK